MWASVALVDITITLLAFIAKASQQPGSAGHVLIWVLLSLGEPETVLKQSL